MKFESINLRYTEVIAEWLAKGYTINFATMSGHQGEISKIDLTDGKEIIRIMLDTACTHEHTEDENGKQRYYHFDMVALMRPWWPRTRHSRRCPHHHLGRWSHTRRRRPGSAGM